MTADLRFARRALAAVLLGVVAFTVYGSLVPLDFRYREPSEAADSFLWAMQNRWWIESRSDGIANVMLGVPLGYALLGLLRAGTTNRAGDVLVGLLLLPGCLLFAAAVEFAQLYAPERTCSGSDVLCQGFGSLLGMAIWVAAGRWLLGQAEVIWSGGDSARRLLIAYLVLLAFIQLLPMDLSASPRDLYRKLRDNVVYVPFGEFRGMDGAKTWERAAGIVKNFGLYLPIGLLARRVFPSLGVREVLLAVAVAGGMEALQLIVKSRLPSATDVVVGAGGALAGFVLARRAGQIRLLLMALWAVALAFISWQPFEWSQSVAPFDWLPGLPLERGSPLFALEDMLTKLVLFALGGALCSSRLAFMAGIAVSAILEAGQTVFASHTASITDVLLGGLGAWIGYWVKRKAERI